MKKFFSLMLVSTMMLGGLLAFSNNVLATSTMDFDTSPLDTQSLGLEKAQGTGLQGGDIRVTVANIIRVAMGLLGIVAVVIVLIGGFYWMTAGGDESRVETGKKWIFSGIIGLAIILSAYALTSFVINNLLAATGGAADAGY